MIQNHFEPTPQLLAELEAEAAAYGNAKLMKVTPELAKFWLENCRYDLQRNMRKADVNKYIKRMKRGEWNPGRNITFAIPTWDPNRKILLNGYHRLEAVIKSDTDQIFSITEVRVGTEDELADQYATIDRVIIRTMNDTLRVKRMDTYTGLRTQRVQRSTASIKFLVNGFVRTSVGVIRPGDDAEMLEYLMLYNDEIGRYWDLVDAHRIDRRDITLRMSVIAPAIALFSEAEKNLGVGIVEPFLEKILTGELLVRGDPRFCAFTHLRDFHLNSKKKAGYISVEQQTRVILYCWNAWVNDKQVKVVQYNQFGEEPVYIEGTTSWKGK